MFNTRPAHLKIDHLANASIPPDNFVCFKFLCGQSPLYGSVRRIFVISRCRTKCFSCLRQLQVNFCHLSNSPRGGFLSLARELDLWTDYPTVQPLAD